MLRTGVVLLSPDDRSLAHFSSEQIEMFATDTCEPRWSHPQEIAATIHPSFSHDGRILAVGGSSSPQVWLLNPDTGEELATLTPPGDHTVTAVAFSPDDQTLAVVHGPEILLWDLRLLRGQLASLGLDW